MNEIYLYGTVGSSWWDEDYFTAKTVREQLAGLSGPLTVRINSGGGIATEGQAIYTALRGYNGTVDVVIEGVAASAASLIAMAGDTITMSLGSILMIHDPASWYVDGRGTEDDHTHAAGALRVLANAYAGIYAKRAGISVDEARAVMKAETYYDGSAAVAAGFATAIDEETTEQSPAAFDYRIYQHAPKGLLTAAGAIQRQRPRAMVLAMMAGTAHRPGIKGEKPMPKQKMTAVTAADDDVETMEDEDDLLAEDQTEEDMAAEDEEDIDTEGEDTSEGDDTEGDDEEDAAPKSKAKAKAKAKASAALIVEVCATYRRPSAEAQDMISRGLNLKQAIAEATAKAAKEPSMNARTRMGASTARITRDERDTRRKGMAGALAAQMARERTVSGPARDDMGMGLMQMAAECVGQRGSVRRGAGEVRVLEMALGSGSTSDFPAIFENALNKRLLAAYQAAEPSYRKISTRLDFTDFRPHPISAIGDFPTLLPVGETGEIKFGSTSDKKELVTLGAYARGFSISRQMMINDDLGGIDRILATRGLAVAAFEDAVFYASLLSGANADGPTLLETTRQVFNTTDLTKAGTAAAITVASISAGRAAMRKKKGLGGKPADQLELDITPSIILVGADKETEAEQLLATIQPQAVSAVNPFSGKLEIVVSNKIAANAWYLFANPAMAPVMMYGYLVGEEGPRMRMDEPFGTQGVAYSVELDFGVGAIDYRGAYKNAGA